METTVHKVLGQEKIKEIYVKNGLNEDDQKLVDQLLEKWEGLVGQLEEKVRVAIDLIGDNPRYSQILQAVTEISLEVFGGRTWLEE